MKILEKHKIAGMKKTKASIKKNRVKEPKYPLYSLEKVMEIVKVELSNV